MTDRADSCRTWVHTVEQIVNQHTGTKRHEHYAYCDKGYAAGPFADRCEAEAAATAHSDAVHSRNLQRAATSALRPKA